MWCGEENTTSDTRPPSTTISGKLNDDSDYIFNTWTNSNFVNIFLGCKDQANGSGCRTTQYCIGAEDTCIFSPYFDYIQISEEGLFYINYLSTDLANNTEETKTRTVKIDTTPPGIIIYSPQNTTYTGKEISLNVSSNEPISNWSYFLNSPKR